MAKIKNIRLYKIFFLFIIVFVLQVTNCNAEILKAANFDTLHKIVISEASDESLVLFDVDDVLIAPTDEFNFRSEIRKTLKNELAQDKEKKEIQEIFSDFFLKRKVQLVNKNMPSLLAYLKNKRIPASALSAWWTNQFGKINEMEHQRLKELNHVGISFVDISPFNKDIDFTSHKNEKGGTPMIISGVILTALADKGEILGLALNQTKSKFKKIIFIDDQMKYLHEVEKFCNEKGIEFLGIHYTEASKLPIPVLDPEKEKLRFDILKRDQIWLLDDELRKLL